MRKTALVFLLVTMASGAQANLLRNSGFELVPDGTTGQGIMPLEWVTVNSTPDTYSNDGSYGLFPDGFGNFNGLTAYEGIRWVAGWSSAVEHFGQLLTSPLTAGTQYSFTASMIQSVRNDLDNPGGYQLYLTSGVNTDPATGVFLGVIGFTSDLHVWEQFSLNFIAPENAAALPFLAFSPIGQNATSAYAGLDDVSLTAVPVPAAIWLMGGALFGLFNIKRRT